MSSSMRERSSLGYLDEAISESATSSDLPYDAGCISGPSVIQKGSHGGVLGC
jgi:hypothetical protein